MDFYVLPNRTLALSVIDFYKDLLRLHNKKVTLGAIEFVHILGIKREQH